MRERPFMGQAAAPAAPAQQEMIPLACPTGPDTLDVIDAATGFVYYRNQPGVINSHPDCKKFGYAYDPAAPAPPAPSAAPAPGVPQQPEGIKWLGPTPGSPYKPFLSSYPPVNSYYTVAQGTPFNAPPKTINVATQPALPAPTPPPMAPMPAVVEDSGPSAMTLGAIAAGVLALGVGAYFLIFGK